MAFTYKLELADGAPADPPTMKSATPTWNAGDIIHFGRQKSRSCESATVTPHPWSSSPNPGAAERRSPRATRRGQPDLGGAVQGRTAPRDRRALASGQLDHARASA
jgi:hypothetical protein